MAASDVLDRVRDGCASVADRSRHVRINHERLAAYPDLVLCREMPKYRGSADKERSAAEATAALVVQLDAVNFGSGWHPVLQKRPGLSGARTIETCVRERAERAGVWTATQLTALTPRAVATVVEQNPRGPAGELMELFARSLNDLGAHVLEHYDGKFLNLIEAAARSAARLVELLAAMPLYRDVVTYDRVEVALYKRAQITAADLAGAFDSEGPGAFGDLDRLTLFADNLVPHVLRIDGVLEFHGRLVSRIKDGELLAYGSPEEVEIRAVAVHAVELLAARTGLPPRQIDEILWTRGAEPRYKAVPRHRCRTTAY